MFFVRNMFYLAAFFYLLAWGFVLFCRGRSASLFRGPLWIGLFANFLSAAGRYYFSWPLMPMYQTPFFLPLFIGVLLSKRMRDKEAGRLLPVSAVCLLSLTAVFFPKDFYLPFLESRTIFSHLFFLSGVVGKACFIIAGIHAIDYICLCHADSGRQVQKLKNSEKRNQASRWIIWGFAFWTISMFSGEIWSYLGWGSPVVWDDAAILTAMATWFYYACFLHLHLQKTWNFKKRSYAAILGAVLTLVFNFYSDLGRFQLPDLDYLFQL